MSKVALVTGGTRGIGEAISKGLKAAGYTVAANYSGNDEAAAKFKAETGIAVYKFDVGDYEATAAAIKQIEADLGPVEILVNNAGITRDGFLHKMTPEQWLAVTAVHLNGSFFVSRAAADHFRAQSSGSFIHMTSTSGLIGNQGQANYSAAKMGIVGLSRSIAIDMVRFNVRSNCIAPSAWSRCATAEIQWSMPTPRESAASRSGMERGSKPRICSK